MQHENRVQANPLYSFISLVDFMAILGIDDREDMLSRYCIITATFTIEHYCKRWLVTKKHTDFLTYRGDFLFTLCEYPICKILSIKVDSMRRFNAESLLEPERYYCVPDDDLIEELSSTMMIQHFHGLPRAEGAIRVRYVPGDAPADLASACMELAARNMTRYKGYRIGMTGIIRRSGKDTENIWKCPCRQT
jgi:hypothetical protein